MANYKEEIAKILEQYVQQVLVDGRSSAETYAAEILRVLSSMELPELPLISPDEIADARLHPDLSDLPSVMLPICECISLQETAAYTTVAKKQRDSDLAIIQPILAALRAEIKDCNRRHINTIESMNKKLSTARAKTAKEIFGDVEIWANNHLGKEWTPHEYATFETLKAAYLAPDKEGGK